MARLDFTFYQQPTIAVAKQLLGKRFVRIDDGIRLTGVIVEVEAYLARRDPASHSYRGIGKKNRSMFDPPGTFYVYPIHAKYCMNVVTEEAGVGAAVLIRALEPDEGINLMKLRGGNRIDRDLLRGPARSCQALAIDRRFDGIDLCNHPELWIEEHRNYPKFKMGQSPRIGIRLAQKRLLRFFIDGNPFVSGPAYYHGHRRSRKES